VIRTIIRAALWVRDHIYIAREFIRPVETDPQERIRHLEEVRKQRDERS
jgi:hypothetical protein